MNKSSLYLFSVLAQLLNISLAYSQITSSAFAPKVDFFLGTSGSAMLGGVWDLNNDGKLDIVGNYDNDTTGKIIIFKNQSISGVINSSSLVRQEINTVRNTSHVDFGDLDGDGKLDMIAAPFLNSINSTVFSIYLNTSDVDSISFLFVQNVNVSSSLSSIILEDVDGDGKSDLIAPLWYENKIRVYKNTSTLGNISFDLTNFYTLNTAVCPAFVKVVDFTNDGKKEIVVSNYCSNNIYVYTNVSNSIGTTSFSGHIALTAGGGTSRLAIADIDFDGKQDILVTSGTANEVALYKNTTTTTTPSFSTPAKYIVSNPAQLQFSDFDLDGHLDIVAGNLNGSNVSVLRNFFSNTKAINNSTFSGLKTFSVGSNPEAYIGDIDGDGKTDIITINRGSLNISILRNQIIPSNDLVAHYPFSGNPGDSSGFENHGVVAAGVSLTTDKKNQASQAYNFNGTTSAYISVPASTSLNTALMSNLTVSGWINITPGSAPNSEFAIFQFQTISNVNYTLSYEVATKKIKFYNWNGSVGNITITSSDTVSRNQWHHIVLRIDSVNNVNLFIDNKLSGSSTKTLVKPTNPVLNIGRHPNVTNTWNFFGKMDDIRVYSKYLTNSDIENLYFDNVSYKYYNKPTGALNQLSTWGKNTDGTGDSPLSFDSSRTIYHAINNPNPTLGGSLKIGGAGSTLILGNGTNGFNLAIGASDTLSADSIVVSSNVNMTVQGKLLTTKLNGATNTNVQYISTLAQPVAGGLYGNLIVSSSQKMLLSNTTVKGTLGMLQTINTNGFNLTLGTSPSDRGTLNRTQGTIIGKFTRWFAATTNTLSNGSFPIGTPSKYAPVELEFTTANTTGGTVTAEFIPADAAGNGLPIFDFTGFIFIDKMAVDGYWKLSSSISSGTFSIYATANNFAGVNNFADLRLLTRTTSGNWNNPGTATTNTGSNASFVIGRTGLTTVAGEYGIGGDQSNNPLPITLLNFDGKRINEVDVELNWVTGRETNNKAFELWVSVDGVSFTLVDVVRGSGNKVTTTEYTYTHKGAFATGAKKLFYQLKQVNYNGDIIPSAVVTINYDKINKIDLLVNENELSLNVYPNPATNTITIEGMKGEGQLINALGLVIATVNNGQIDVKELQAGVYLIRCGNETIKFVKK